MSLWEEIGDNAWGEETAPLRAMTAKLAMPSSHRIPWGIFGDQTITDPPLQWIQGDFVLESLYLRAKACRGCRVMHPLRANSEKMLGCSRRHWDAQENSQVVWETLSNIRARESSEIWASPGAQRLLVPGREARSVLTGIRGALAQIYPWDQRRLTLSLCCCRCKSHLKYPD